LGSFVEHGGHLVVLGADVTGMAASAKVSKLASDTTGEFHAALLHDFPAAAGNPPKEFLNAATVKSDIEVKAPATVAANFGSVNGSPHIFLANFGGLVPSKVVIPEPAKGIVILSPAALGDTLTFLPFLGETQLVKGEKKGGQMEFVLPAVERGAVVWFGKGR